MTGGPAGADADHRLLTLAAGAFGAKAPGVVGVAVSGGGDSMALLHLMARVQAARGGSVRAVTVDHRLRLEAAGEARFVAQFCESLGVGHDTLVWDHGVLAGNVADLARRARYGLIAGWARSNGVAHVVVGHTADDRAETFLMELARQAGIDGLTAMRGFWVADGIRWSRPLISVGRAVLREYLNCHGIGWIDDPTNEDDRYQRIKARRVLASLAPLGINAEGLAHVAANLALARSDLVLLALRMAKEIARQEAGEVIFDRRKWMGAGNDTGRRLLIGALRWVSSTGYAPRADKIARLEASIWQGRDATLAGCKVRVGEKEFGIAREPKAVAGLETATGALWDGRWRLSGPGDAALSVRALGAEGLRACKGWRDTGYSRAALAVSPAIWRGDKLIAAPLAGKANGWTAEIVTAFPKDVLSH